MTDLDTDKVLVVLAEVLLKHPNRIIQDATVAAMGEHWLQRAQTFENARPKPGDYFGARLGRLDHVPDDPHVQELDRRLAAKATACRMRAYVCDLNEISDTVRAEIAAHLGAAA